MNTLYLFISAVSSFPFLLAAESISFFLKLVLLVYALSFGLRSAKIQRPWYFLLPVLVGAILSDLAWIVSLLQKTYIPAIDYSIIVFIVRFAWFGAIIQYQSLSLFLESLVDNQHQIKKYQKAFLTVSGILCAFWLYMAFFQFSSAHSRPAVEFTMFKACSFYLFLVTVPTLIITLQKVRSSKVPKILKKQFKVLVQNLIGPALFSDFLQNYPFAFFPGYVANNYAVVSVSTVLLSLALYYSAKRMMGLRFLNFNTHVQSNAAFNFIVDFKTVLEQLSHVTNVKELGHITQAFFKGAFDIQPSRVSLSIRKLSTDHQEEKEISTNPMEKLIENFISRHDTATCKVAPLLRQSKILITDEIAFNNFVGDGDSVTDEVVQFLDHINADVFIPIYEKQTIIAYVIVEKNARPRQLFSNIERDEMVVFASYLGNVINLLRNRNLNSMIHKEKEMQEELYSKHQEINQYKESIRSFFRTSKHQKIGILFYKNRQFKYGNQDAKELITININNQLGHPLSKALFRLAHQVTEYKTNQKAFAKDADGNKLVLSGIPNLEQNNTIIMVHYPEVSDLIKNQIDRLKNPTEWDYLLYLETTESGKLINQLIPGSSEYLLNFKVELLKTALSKKALLLELPEEDLLPTVEILHHISLRENLHILKIHSSEQNFDTAMKLFGINPIFGDSKDEKPLLDRLHNTGTLLLQNVHFLNLETQQYLAEFIRYGYYHVFKSDKKVTANVRIICSTNQNLHTLVQQGKFSRILFNELKQTTLSMPPLVTLPAEEISMLADGFTQQAIQGDAFQNLLELTKREKERLVMAKPVSLKEIKEKVLHILQQKSKKNQVFQETQFDPAYNISDPELIQAARLGKKALRDPKIMAMLVNKFKNQNAVAAFLGVNRSSVSRRCKEYNII